MTKITIVGSGSGWGRLYNDIFSYPALKEITITLMDIDQRRLELSAGVVEKFVRQENIPAVVEKTTELSQALDGADFVIVGIDVGGLEAVRYDNEIPYKYGIDQCVGDTLGPGGVFKALRLFPHMKKITDTMEKLCPEALLLNYSNPMAILTWLLYETSNIKSVGLCHSVQSVHKPIAEVLGIKDKENIKTYVAGINHQAWLLECIYKGENLYPRLREKIEREGLPEKDRVRFEIFRQFGYFVTESSGHNSEYLPYFRKRKDIIEKFCRPGYEGESLFYMNNIGKWRDRTDKERERLLNSDEKVPVYERSHEYASGIINAVVTGQSYMFNGNVKNTGLIENLLDGCCVEVPCMADGNGIHPCYVGTLPPQCAALNRNCVNVQELTVKGVINRDKEMIVHAVMLDPLTAAVLSLEEIRNMVNELFDKEKDMIDI